MNEVEYRRAETRLWDAVGVTPTESFVTMPRLGVKVRVQEVGEGEPVLFVHGGPNAGSTWAPMIEHLDGVRALLVDRPGTGLSEPYEVGPENLAHYGRVFAGDVLDGLGIESADVVASSFGGMLSLYSAAAEPERFKRMVQMACPAMAPGQLVPPFMRLMTVGLVRRLLAVLPPNERAGDSILRQIGHGASLDAERIPQIFKDWYLALQEHTDTMKHDGDMIGRLGTISGFPNSLTIPDEVLSAVEAPTLFLWGADDGFGGPDVARDVVARMPAAELVMMPDSGHLPWLDDPRFAAQATMAFLGRGVVMVAPAQAGQR
ncbi:MAG: alpha/beta hydrolase [Acidimicrobiia bacterium]|nr:alpha/beta hydrolase [Acidimicrobiia bacterium]